jgi:hypothetical protein
MFVTCPTDSYTTFFLAFFSARRRKVTLIRAPEIMRRLQGLLTFYFPEKLVNESETVDRLLSYELKSRNDATQSEITLCRKLSLKSLLFFSKDGTVMLLVMPLLMRANFYSL